jgi:hypothetical protein
MSEMSRLGAGRRPPDELRADPRFQLLDALGQRRLRHAEILRGDAEGAGFDDGREVDELPAGIFHGGFRKCVLASKIIV